MPDFSVNDDGEWTFEDGDFVLVSGAEEVRQDIRVRLGLWQGEVQFDQEAGVDAEVVFAAGASPEDVAGEFRDVILGCPGVASVQTPTLEQKPERTLDIAYTAQYSLDNLNVRGAVADKLTIKT